MKLTQLSFVFFAGMICLLLVGRLIPETDAKEPPATEKEPVPFAVLDVARLYNHADTVQAIRTWSTGRQTAIEAELTAFATKLKRRKEDLDLYREGSWKYLEVRDELLFDAMTMKDRERFRKDRLGREIHQRLTRFYKEVGVTAGDYAKANGIRIVFNINDEGFDPESLPTPQALTSTIAGRAVIWWDEELDITDEVLKKLNGE